MLPPLHMRAHDIPEVAIHALEEISHRLGCGPIRLEPSAAEALARHAFDRNARELGVHPSNLIRTIRELRLEAYSPDPQRHKPGKDR